MRDAKTLDMIFGAPKCLVLSSMSNKWDLWYSDHVELYKLHCKFLPLANVLCALSYPGKKVTFLWFTCTYC